MIELFTGIDNKENEKGEIHTTYTIRFTTDSKHDYIAIRNFCRKVLDGDYNVFKEENVSFDEIQKYLEGRPSSYES
jgi:hypothetical protein